MGVAHSAGRTYFLGVKYRFVAVKGVIVVAVGAYTEAYGLLVDAVSCEIDEQIGGQLKAGFTLKEIYSDTNGTGNLHDHNVPSFIATWFIK